ncbi:uncharacterized protein DUF2662 [Orenia metallireducens]|uniref:FHA domain-containing protein n=1 Tax=Orenia metallireducens TaxID=1413210 RepID=A0A285FJ34_9FIRM|nr:FhaA domain-containing protein [Orenia metallireducens]PRX33530.1 uncharacterized protein DUF2662 [Orenia metallireducens]SNY10261.1 Protein of unknown function [Orenia metallireducens]
MKFPMKLARKIKEIFLIDSLNPFYQKMIRKIVIDMENRLRKGTEGDYVPNDYKVIIPLEDKNELNNLNTETENKLKKVILEEIAKKGLKLRGELKLAFTLSTKVEENLMVIGEFSLDEFNLENTEDGGTKIFKVPEENSNNLAKINHTVKVRPLSQRECYLRLLDNGVELKRFEINSIETNIGRQENNEVVLVDHKVSRVHAQIIKKGHYYLINDLNSTNGVFVNNQLIESKRLVDGDKIRLGESELEFCLKM